MGTFLYRVVGIFMCPVLQNRSQAFSVGADLFRSEPSFFGRSRTFSVGAELFGWLVPILDIFHPPTVQISIRHCPFKVAVSRDFRPFLFN